MHIDYIQNNDTILKDTLVPYLCVDFHNNTDTAQYFVLKNYEKYPSFMSGSTVCYATPEDYFAHKNKFEYIKCNDKHYIYIYNNSMEILHTDLRIIKDAEFPEELISTDFSKCYNILKNRSKMFCNDATQIILLNSKQSYRIYYDLSMCALVCGTYEFVFNMLPPTKKQYPAEISGYKRCEKFIGKMDLEFMP
jgi:hypothetical protein